MNLSDQAISAWRKLLHFFFFFVNCTREPWRVCFFKGTNLQQAVSLHLARLSTCAQVCPGDFSSFTNSPHKVSWYWLLGRSRLTALGDWLDKVQSKDSIIEGSALVLFYVGISLGCASHITLPFYVHLTDPVNVRIPQGHRTLCKETEFLYATAKIRNVLNNPRAPEAADLSSSLDRGDLLLCFS